MDLKDEIRGLLHKGYSAINDLNKSADMAAKETKLHQNGLNSQNQAKELIRNLHQLVNSFDIHLQKLLCKTVDDKMKMLGSHSEEIIQCVDYISNLCMMAENLIKEDNLQVVKSFGAELKAEFLKTLKDCTELKLVDYETFTSIDLEVDLRGLCKNPLVNIVSWNHHCMEKKIIQSIGFGNLDEDVILSLSLNQASRLTKKYTQDDSCLKSSKNCSSILVSKPVIRKTHDKNYLEIPKKSAAAAISVKNEMEKSYSPFKLQVSLSDCPVTGEQKYSSFSSRNPKDIKVELQNVKTEHSTYIDPSTVTTSEKTAHLHFSPQEMCAFTNSKNETEQTSHKKIDSFNSLRLEPIKMTFDLRTVLPSGGSRVPEILGECVKVLTGGTSTSFNHPIGLTVTADGLIVIADTGNNMVKVMDNDTLILTIGNNDGVKFVRPSAVITDTDGNIYVKDDICVQIFNGKGKLLQTVGKSCFRYPYGLALVKHENDSSLLVIDAEKTKPTVYNYFIREKKLQSYPYMPILEYGLPCSKVRFLAVYNNTMLVSDLGASNMYLSYLNGKAVRTFGGYGYCMGEFKEPSGITVDAVGNWIVGDSKNNRIQVFTNDGNLLAIMKLSTPIWRPSGIHLTSDGHLYVISYLNAVINVYKLHL